MITLFSFGKGFGLVDPSPFVLKADIYLRMAELSFETKSAADYLKQAPKGKLPFIEDNGEKIADSEFIIEHLITQHNADLDKHLNSTQKSQAHLMTKSLDENLYWCLVYSRWLCEDTWPLLKDHFFARLPQPLKSIVPRIIRRQVKKNLYGQGISRHSQAEVLIIADKTFAALSELLAEKSYFFGEQPSRFDATAFAILAEFICVDFDNAFNQKAREYENLVAYCQRCLARYYP